jgi:hypothetical protein
LWLIREFGYQAVKEIPLGWLRNMVLAENIYKAYNGRRASTGTDEGWSGWEKNNPDAAKLLREAESAAFAEGGDNGGGS